MTPGQGRGPPEDVQHRRARRQDDGSIQVGADRLEELEDQINWQSLSPFEEYVLLVLVETGLFE